jgi:hypothetical protein
MVCDKNLNYWLEIFFPLYSNCSKMGQICNHILISKIAKKIKHDRESIGITQEVFYFDINIHVGRIEIAKTNITNSTLDAICNYLGTDLVTFFKELSEQELVEKDNNTILLQ